MIISLVPLTYTKLSNNSIIFSYILGISYTTFRAISFIVDCYKERIVEYDIFDYLLYMLFFPLLLSGPIEQSSKFIKNIDNIEINWNNFISGLITILFGFLIKLSIADRLIGNINYVYDNCLNFGYYSIFAILLYSIYIYCDFYGYSLIACGTSKIFGYEADSNFKQPYFSSGVIEFWKRWHTSLNNWFINYLYIPLGGNRKGIFRKYLNILIIFFISGMWHGNSMNFILWGILNGILEIIECRIKKDNKDNKKNKAVSCIFTYIVISFTWIVFANDINKTFEIIHSLFLEPAASLTGLLETMCISLDSSKNELIIIFLLIMLLFTSDLLKEKKINISTLIANANIIVRYFIFIVLIISIVLFGKLNGGFNENEFIYFKF